jgi:hypothetical protein
MLLIDEMGIGGLDALLAVTMPIRRLKFRQVIRHTLARAAEMVCFGHNEYSAAYL